MGTYNSTLVLLTSYESVSLVQSENKIMNVPRCPSINSRFSGLGDIKNPQSNSNSHAKKRYLSHSEFTRVIFQKLILSCYLYLTFVFFNKDDLLEALDNSI